MAAISEIFSSPKLPTLPTVAVRLLELQKDPESGIMDVVGVIRTDPAISAKLITLANSTYFALRSPVASIDRAAQLLGSTVVTSVALSFYLSENAAGKGPMAEHFRSYWTQSVIQAMASEILATRHTDEPDGESFLAGLMMDIGRLAMLSTIEDKYRAVLEMARDENRTLHEVETEMLGFNHVQVGTELMQRWQFSELLVASIERHHAEADELVGEVELPMMAVLAMSSSVGDYFCTSNKGPALERLQTLADGCYGLTETQLQELLDETKRRLDEVGVLFSVDSDQLPSTSDLYAEAVEQLSQLVVREHVNSVQASTRMEMFAAKTEQLEKETLHDPLTKIYNRRFLEELLVTEVHRCCRSAQAIGLIFADIDHFKVVNDTYGHQFGDEVLKRVVAAIASVARDSDILARYGGEEFVVLISQPNEKGIQRMAEWMRAAVEAEEILLDGKPVPVTISIGASIAIPGRTETDLHERLIAAADTAMYDAKQNGRNQVRVRSLINESERHFIGRVTQVRFSRWLVSQGEIDVAEASKALIDCEAVGTRLGELAQHHGYLDAEQTSHILQEQEQDGKRFGEIARRLGLLAENDLICLMALQQEDPVQLAQSLVQNRALDQQRVVNLLKQYQQEINVAALGVESAF